MGTAALRMVAFGVFEPVVFNGANMLPRVEQYSLEVRRLVQREIKELGWLFTGVSRFRNDMQFVVLGRLGTGAAWPTRLEIGRGTYRECCLAAVEYLDRHPEEAPPDDPPDHSKAQQETNGT